ncbi:glycosyl transferase family 90 [Capnocytophaga bilenii]|uniref:glycosyl transferase family 90 n=1 Tax=Capnocytophaga bilenii TaxID=2819369 RepID=UPI0028D89F67|nr:glycosyl transferase family 90 [Capnocytophaga bilenii]
MKIIKQNKLWYYLRNYAIVFLGKRGGYQQRMATLKAEMSEEQLAALEARVTYYCKLSAPVVLSREKHIRDLRSPKSPKAYYFDTYRYARYFDENNAIDFVFGDVIHTPEMASLVKSRPIGDGNENSVLLKLDEPRHYIRIVGDQPFRHKKNLLIGRGAIYQQHRFDFYDKYFGHQLCDLGSVGKKGIGKAEWEKPKMGLKEHLDYKFVLSLQGNDVATNLKWIMSSNSVAVMPKPTIETWFMEGTLVGGVHYIEIAADYSDLEAQLEYYIVHPEACEAIIKNAQQHTATFWNKKTEELCHLMVLERYFSMTNS